jgi:hypothetical protein
MEDKTLHATIAKLCKPSGKRRMPLRNIPHEIIKSARPSFPRLERPKLRGGFDQPDRGWVYLPTKVRWHPEMWWRFKRAAYAQGKHATALMREMMQKVVDDYEATL